MTKAQDIVIAALEMEVAVLRLQVALKGLDTGKYLDEYLEQALKISQVVGKSFSKSE